eukprot:m.24129 g.24129  ORF g.24129 m.24129 type:complete len:175 (-) comp11472_c0_seq2:516-1040(-)
MVVLAGTKSHGPWRLAWQVLHTLLFLSSPLPCQAEVRTTTSLTSTTLEATSPINSSTPISTVQPSQPSFTTLPRPSDLTQAFEIIDEAAINMDGVSFYVNYNIVDGTLEDVITTCFEEADCVSFDYNKGQGRAWFHKIPRRCAGEAGAAFVTNRKDVVYYEKLQGYRGAVFPTT